MSSVLPKFENIDYVKRYGATTKYSWHVYICGHCNTQVNGAVVGSYPREDGPIKWLICTNCSNGSVLTHDGVIYPPVMFGPSIEGLSPALIEAYTEARKCLSICAFTSCELICRKILMHVAVEKGAKDGDSFSNYISHLENKGFVTPPMSGWVKLIRKHGNKANHQLNTPDKKQAESTLMFTAELLRLIYEMETISNRYTSEDI